MFQPLTTGIGWFIYRLKGLIGLIMVTSIIAIIGSAGAFVFGIVEGLACWPFYLLRGGKSRVD